MSSTATSTTSAGRERTGSSGVARRLSRTSASMSKSVIRPASTSGIPRSSAFPTGRSAARERASTASSTAAPPWDCAIRPAATMCTPPSASTMSSGWSSAPTICTTCLGRTRSRPTAGGGPGPASLSRRGVLPAGDRRWRRLLGRLGELWDFEHHGFQGQARVGVAVQELDCSRDVVGPPNWAQSKAFRLRVVLEL